MNACLKAILVMLPVAIAACGGGGGGGSPAAPVNTAPTANFAFSCADLACTFTSTSTDQDVGDAITAYGWTFGDASAGVTTATTAHTFAAASTYDVTLRVTDRSGATGTVVRQVAVAAPPVPAAPHANFTASCVSLDCTFTDTSTFDTGSVFQSRSWNFGDGATAATTSPVAHRYAATAPTTFSVRLTVADAAGKTSTSAQSIVVAPPATSLGCVAGNCVLSLAQASRVTATLLSHSCGARNNQVIVTSPVMQTIFPDGCFDPINIPVAINGGMLFAAGTSLQVEVRSGTVADSTLVFAPAIRVSGDFANGWVLTFDDGYGGPGEPDFNDLVIFVKATP